MKYRKLHESLKKNKEKVVVITGVSNFRFALEDTKKDVYSFQDLKHSCVAIYADTFGELIEKMEDYMDAEYFIYAVKLFNEYMDKYNEEHHVDCEEEEGSEKKLKEEVEELKKKIRIKEDMIKCIKSMSEHSIKVKFEEKENERI